VARFLVNSIQHDKGIEQRHHGDAVEKQGDQAGNGLAVRPHQAEETRYDEDSSMVDQGCRELESRNT
jgi:hypothetical protein